MGLNRLPERPSEPFRRHLQPQLLAGFQALRMLGLIHCNLIMQKSLKYLERGWVPIRYITLTRHGFLTGQQAKIHMNLGVTLTPVPNM